MKNVERIVRLIIEGFGILATLILVAMMMVTVCDVFLRLFGRPIIGSTEISCAMMVCVVFFGVAWCALRGEHIRVDIISGLLSKRKLLVLDSIDNIVTMVLALLLAKQCLSQAMFARQMELKSLMLEIPRYPFHIVTAFGFFLLFITMIVLQINIIRGTDQNVVQSVISEEDKDRS